MFEIMFDTIDEPSMIHSRSSTLSGSSILSNVIDVINIIDTSLKFSSTPAIKK